VLYKFTYLLAYLIYESDLDILETDRQIDREHSHTAFVGRKNQ